MSQKRALDRPDRLETELTDHPPSAKYVYTVLQYEGPMTRSELQRTTLLPERTVGYALTELARANLVEKRIHGTDARVREYVPVCPDDD